MDEWYALQVLTGKERDVAAMLCRNGIQAYAPDVMRYERKGGEWRIVQRTAIPGYVFVRCRMTVELYYHLGRKPGVVKLLGMGDQQYTAIPAEQVAWIEAVRTACGGDAGRVSRAVMGEDDELVIVDGPLLALKDNIAQIDARRRRATVMLELLGEIYETDMAIEVDKHPDESAAG